MEENWRFVNGYENLYMVSNMGRVYSMASKRIIKPYQKLDYTRHTENRYMRVTLADGGHYKRFFVHRLVGEAFVPNPLNKPQINHKNNVKADNRDINLEWVNQSENTQHSYDNGYRDRNARGWPKTIFLP